MNYYNIAKKLNIDTSANIYLLNIGDNIDHIKKEIIPKAQIDEISLNKTQHDSDKRFLARTFLYEYLKAHYGIINFELEFNKYQKPFLKAEPRIHFSFSYAKDYVLIGISRDKKLSVDIEYINPALNINEIAPDIMCVSELNQFNSYVKNSINQRIYFFTLFSAKESIIKAFGTGLYFDIKKINILKNSEHIYKSTRFVYSKLGLWLNNYTLAVCFEKRR